MTMAKKAPAARAIAATDPIFALIEEHRTANVEKDLWSAKFESSEEISDADDVTYDLVYNRECEAQRRLFATNPTTVAGVEAFAAHILKYPRIAEFDGPEFNLTKAVATIAAALRDIAE